MFKKIDVFLLYIYLVFKDHFACWFSSLSTSMLEYSTTRRAYFQVIFYLFDQYFEDKFSNCRIIIGHLFDARLILVYAIRLTYSRVNLNFFNLFLLIIPIKSDFLTLGLAISQANIIMHFLHIKIKHYFHYFLENKTTI